LSVRAVLFDAGNTLLFLDYERLAAGVSPVVDFELTASGLARCADQAAREMERAAATDRERASLFLDALFRLAGVPEGRLEDVRAVLLRLHGERHLWTGVDSGTVAALSRLRAAGLLLGVVSNSDGRVEQALAAAGLRDYFDVVVDSGLTGIEKPDPRIFAAALAALGVAPEAAVYIGDIYEVDVVGARAAGLSAALVDPDGRHAGRGLPTGRSVAEVIDLLARQGALRLDPAESDHCEPAVRGPT
jgi:putative hydrolase of the HAD superfamily